MAFDDKENVKTEEIEKGAEDLSPPQYLSVDISPDDRQKLESWIDGHLNQIEKEMNDVLSRFEMERDQLEGNMPSADYPYPGAFRINMPVTKKKVRELVNRIKQAYLDSDPIWAVNTQATELLDTAMKIEQALDFAMDNELDSADNLAQALFEAGLHGSGFIVPGWDYQEDVVRDVVRYTGYDGKTMESLSEVFRFETDFPNWREEDELKKMHRSLSNGKDVEKEVTYTAVTQSRPEHVYVPSNDVRVYPSTDGIRGLRVSPLYGYQKQYSRLELEHFSEQETIDASELLRITHREMDEPSPREEAEPFTVAHLTIRYKFKDSDVYSRYKVWFERKSKVVLRIRAFPWWVNEPDLIPFYIRHEDPGFFKKGIAWDTLDDHTGLNAMFNLLLNAIDMANSMRWKAKENSVGYAHILNRRWSPHIPVPYRTDPNEIQTMATPTNHIAAVVQGLELLRRNTDENTGTSALQSGRESPTDPSAPAAKTALLLQQVEPNIKEYIRSLESGFRLLGKWTLMLYYQAIRLGWIESLPGAPDIPVEVLKETAEKLAPRALLFEFDRAGRQQRNLLLFNTFATIFSQVRPDIVIKLARIVISEWDSHWSKIVDTLGLEETPQLPAVPPEGASAPQQTPTSQGGNGGLPQPRFDVSQLIGRQP